MTENPLDKRRAEVLEAVLDHAPFDGWTQTALRRAGEDLEMDEAEVNALFPGGGLDAIDFFIAKADRDMERALAEADLSDMGISARIAFAIKTRLEPLAPHREAMRRALHVQMLPQNGPRMAKGLYGTVDSIWRAIGDTSTDWNFYTKRATLAGVYAATVLVWLSDESEDFAESWAFLDRRIGDVLRIEGVKADLRDLSERLPQLTRILGDLRYFDPRRPRF